MSAFGAFQSSVLGMISQSHALGVIGANIANVATGGFKRTDTHFHTLLGETMASQPGSPNLAGPLTSQSDIAGVQAKDYARIALQGQIASGDGLHDAAINGRGFFVLGDAPGGTGQTAFTRDGAFVEQTGAAATITMPDGTMLSGNETYLSDAGGRYVLGWPVDAMAGAGSGVPAGSGALGPIRTDPFAFASRAQATSEASLALNLPAFAADGTAERYSIEIFDSIGRPRPIELSFTKSAANAWDIAATGSPGDALTLGPAPVAPLNFSPTGETIGAAPYSLSIAHADGATSAFSLDMSGFKQYSGAMTPLAFARDGYSAGVLDSVSFDAAGTVFGTFTNGLSRPLYRLALADFSNPEGLTPLSGNLFAESEASGAAVMGSAGEGGFGVVVPDALEQSNVALSDEFTKMMVTQQAYNASATAFRTTDEMSTIARDLKR